MYHVEREEGDVRTSSFCGHQDSIFLKVKSDHSSFGEHQSCIIPWTNIIRRQNSTQRKKERNIWKRKTTEFPPHQNLVKKNLQKQSVKKQQKHSSSADIKQISSSKGKCRLLQESRRTPSCTKVWLRERIQQRKEREKWSKITTHVSFLARGMIYRNA